MCGDVSLLIFWYWMRCAIDELVFFSSLRRLRLRLGLEMRFASRPSSSVKWCVLILSSPPFLRMGMGMLPRIVIIVACIYA